jgi:hypothetical protein
MLGALVALQRRQLLLLRFAQAGQRPHGTAIPIHGLPIHEGSGKAVLFWDGDAQASKFLSYSDVESADSHWITDPDLQVPSKGGCALLPDSPTACGGGNGSGLTAAQAELPANYAYSVTRLERLKAIEGARTPLSTSRQRALIFGRSSTEPIRRAQ